MADVSLILHDECMDDSDEGFEQGDCPVGSPDDDSALTPLMRIQKYAQSSQTFLRHKVAKTVLEEFRTCPPEILIDDLPEIMKILVRMGDEWILRVELLEQIPLIAAQAIECSTRVSVFKNIVSDHVIPLVVRNLGYSENTLITHSTLIQLIEQGFISKLQAEIQVCPTILALTKLETAVDINTGAINLMSKLAPLLGRDVTERVFLGRLIELCSSPMFHIRKVCATHFGNFCAVIGKATVEKILLPQYLSLCIDDVWGVRKTCAEVVTYISCACTQQSRISKLAPAFAILLQDDCRWVKVSAFQSLGPFISTFSNPPVTNMGYNSNGDLVLFNNEGSEFTVSCSPSSLTISERYARDESIINSLNFELEESESVVNLKDNIWLSEILKDDMDEIPNTLDVKTEEKADPSTETSTSNADGNLITMKEILEEPKSSSNIVSRTSCDNVSEKINENLTDDTQNIKLIVNNAELENESSTNIGNKRLKSNATEEDKVTNIDTNDSEKKVIIIRNDSLQDDLHSFNSHNYWYISPELPLDPVIVAAEEKSSTLSGAGDVISLSENKPTPENATDSNESTISLDENDIINENIITNNLSLPKQTIVPQILVDHFISMTHPMLSMKVEHELAYHCAYSLPAVVLTLGSENWQILENTVFTLARDMQYKVRRTVASSLHELAIILGADLATESLSQLFDGFIKDLDEVRIGILKHLSSFLKVIKSAKRDTYLPRLVEFLQTDNEWNWRFREELAKQLLESMELFKPSDISKHVGVIAIDLLCDKVAAVREAALSLVTEIISYTASETNLTSNFLMKLAENFAHSKKWKRRQTFCLMCTELLKEQALEAEKFMSEVMPHLLDLSWDPVANIRLVVARCLSGYVFKNEYFLDASNEHYEGLETVLRRLQADKDCDVRQCAEADFSDILNCKDSCSIY